MDSPRRRPMLCCCGALMVLAATAFPPAADAASQYSARDTLQVDHAEAGSPEARRMLRDIGWTPQQFSVTVREADSVDADRPLGARADALVTFPSPRPRDPAEATVNTVSLEWYAARAGDRTPLKAPAVVVLHILDGRMTVARAIARSLAERGIHGFVMHMPGYADRRIPGGPFNGAVFFELCIQAAADARRARDAVAAIPRVDADRVSIQGTSLGGFIAASAAALDGAFDRTFIALAGGDLYGLFQNGRREAEMIRQRLEEAGFRGEALRRLCDRIDPRHLAHRLPPERTWLFSALADQVVPRASARALAETAGLGESHHVWLPADHYSAVLHLPWMIQTLADSIRAGDTAEQPGSSSEDTPSERPRSDGESDPVQPPANATN